MDDAHDRTAADASWQRLLQAARDSGTPERAAGLLQGCDAAMRDLYSPLWSSLPAQDPLVIGHIGQSLDGFIATDAGESRFVTGRDNILHMHRMRALCDAVIVGAGTVAADDPQLTTREVPGPNPLRVVLDPRRRLSAQHRVFRDGEAGTLLVQGQGASAADIEGVESLRLTDGEGLDLRALLHALHARGCRRVFVEGGGRTVSAFLEAGLLHRLQVTIAPLLIGSGRPSIRVRGSVSLADCLRARHRVFRMGSDVLFDLDLAERGDGAKPGTDLTGMDRIL
jgi:diaminohydroxyphosphoribosylaminopyrimidine deaminase/5-amino-6-(5-phosphoribosylamino)uracil reductase